MSKHVSVIAIVVALGSVLACGSDPPPAPASPPVTASAPTAATVTVAATAPASTLPATTASTPAADPSNPDLVTCLGHMDPKATDACKGCMAASCLAPIKTMAAACPDFSKCICDGTKTMMDCAPTMMSPACMQPGMAVGACSRQSCAAQCSSRAATPAATGTAPGAAPGGTSGDSCTALSACCAQVPGGAPPSCVQLVGTKNAQACGSLLTAFRNMNKCH